MDTLWLDCPETPLALRPKNNKPSKPKQCSRLLWRMLDVATGLRGGSGAQKLAVEGAAKPHPGVTSAARRGRGVGSGDFILTSGNWSSSIHQGNYLCARDAG